MAQRQKQARQQKELEDALRSKLRVITFQWAELRKPLKSTLHDESQVVGFRYRFESLRSVEEMIGSTERGVLVTRLWYIREVDPYEKIVTGMTRDGTFLVENGKVQCGLRNFRFNQSLISMLSNVEAMSEVVRASGEESFDMVVPAMKVREFNFTEATKF